MDLIKGLHDLLHIVAIDLIGVIAEGVKLLSQIQLRHNFICGAIDL